MKRYYSAVDFSGYKQLTEDDIVFSDSFDTPEEAREFAEEEFMWQNCGVFEHDTETDEYRLLWQF